MRGQTYRADDRPTLAEIAAKAGRSIADTRQAVIDRRVPIRNSRIDGADVPMVLFGLRDIATPDTCEHKHWYEDEDRDHRRVHICEDCGDSILVSEIEREEP